MLESNTDRMYFTIGAAIAAGLIIGLVVLLINGFPGETQTIGTLKFTGFKTQIVEMVNSIFGGANGAIDEMKGDI